MASLLVSPLGCTIFLLSLYNSFNSYYILMEKIKKMLLTGTIPVYSFLLPRTLFKILYYAQAHADKTIVMFRSKILH